MANDDALALYGAAKTNADTMIATHTVLVAQMAELDAQTAALQEKITALGAGIAELKQLPRALGQQTSQYIAQGVREAIRDDFSRPIAEAVDGPIARFAYATDRASGVIQEIRSESKFQNWSTAALVILLGITLGVLGSYFFYSRQLGQISDRLDSIQQQMAPPAPVADTKPVDGKPAKAHKTHGTGAQANP